MRRRPHETQRRYVIRLLWNGGKGLTPQEISEELHITRQAVDRHLKAIRSEADDAKSVSR